MRGPHTTRPDETVDTGGIVRRSHHDLSAALGAAVEDARDRLGLQVDYRFGGESMQPVQIVAIVDELVREALDNVARHAGVDSASVEVDARDELRLRVRDHGNGFQAADSVGSGDRSTHLGRALRAARDLGAVLMLASAPGQGTMLRLRLSLDDDRVEGRR